MASGSLSPSASSSSASGRCTSPGCSLCSGFAPQWYRPALCAACFHSVALHFPAEWVEEVDSQQRVTYKHQRTGERLSARPADVADSGSSTAARVRELARARGGDERASLLGGEGSGGFGPSSSSSSSSSSAAAGGQRPSSTVGPQIQMWTAFLDNAGSSASNPKSSSLPGTSDVPWPSSSSSASSLSSSSTASAVAALRRQVTSASAPGAPPRIASNIFAETMRVGDASAVADAPFRVASSSSTFSSSSSTPLLGLGSTGDSTVEGDSGVTYRDSLSSSSSSGATSRSIGGAVNVVHGTNNKLAFPPLISTGIGIGAGGGGRGRVNAGGILDNDDDDDDDIIVSSPSARTPGSSASLVIAASAMPDAPTAVPSTALAALSIDLSQLSRNIGGTGGPGGPGGAGGGVQSPRSSSSAAVVSQPVPPMSVPPTSPLAATSPFSSASSSSALLPPPPPPPLPLAAGGGDGGQGANASSTEPLSPSSPLALNTSNMGSSASSLVPQSPVGTVAAVASPRVESAPASSSSSSSQSSPPIDLAEHLSPIFGDPLTVDLAQISGKGGIIESGGRGLSASNSNSSSTSGVTVFRVQQPAEEDILFPRYLVVTPFTIMALAPHPTRLGQGVLKWERSILCLQHMVTQPLFSALPATAPSLLSTSSLSTSSSATSGVMAVHGGGGGRKSSQEMVSLGGEVGSGGGGGAAGGAGGGGQEAIFDSLPFGATATGGARAASASTDLSKSSSSTSSTFRSTMSSVRNLFSRSMGNKEGATAASSSSSSSARSLPLATTTAPTRYRMYGIGLLASFAPETPDTICFLRTYRAGKRPVTLRGFLLKRKRSAWRERAPLGPLAWKKRWFVLEAMQITYFKSEATGAVAKGVIPLTGWVEVTRAGPDAGVVAASLAPDATTRPHSFVVRTGQTYHVFQASSAAEADEWMSAIAVNAQHLGAMQDDPQCIILPSHQDAENLSSIIARRRADLLASMGSAAAANLPSDLTVDISASEVMDHHVRARTQSQTFSLAALQREQQAQEEAELAAAVAQAQAQEEAELAAAVAQAQAQDMSLPATDGAAPASTPTAAASSSSSLTGEDGITVGEAEALIIAMGGEVSDEFLQQLPHSVAEAIAAKYRPGESRTTTSASNGQQPHHHQHHQHQHRSVAPPLPIALPIAPAFRPPGEFLWSYLDDSYQPQGPFPDSSMRSWLWGKYFGPDTLVRCVDPYPFPTPDGLPPRNANGQAPADPSEAAGLPPGSLDAGGAPKQYLPLSTLFPNPMVAFTPAGVSSWLSNYANAIAFQALLASALTLGLDRQGVTEAVVLMRQHRLPPDISIVLDILEENEQVAARARARAAGSDGGRGTGGDGAGAADVDPSPAAQLTTSAAPAPTATAGAASANGAVDGIGAASAPAPASA